MWLREWRTSRPVPGFQFDTRQKGPTRAALVHAALLFARFARVACSTEERILRDMNVRDPRLGDLEPSNLEPTLSDLEPADPEQALYERHKREYEQGIKKN